MANKMFNYFAGTKEQFIAKNYPTSHANEIVFIKGGGDASKSCIFAQGMYFANFAELLAAINYVKGISVGGQQYNAALGGGYVAFGAKDPSTIAVNAGQNGVEIGLTDTFVNKVNNTATNLGVSTDAADSTGSAFARIANLAAIVGQLTGSEGGDLESVEGQITKAINALKAEILGTLDTDDAKTLQAINDELDSIGTSISGINAKYDALEPRVKTIEDDYLKEADKTALANRITTEAPVTIAEAAGSGDILKTYTFTQNGKAIGTINLAKELVVTGGDIVEIDGVKNLQLTIANQTTPVNIPVNELVDAYTAQQDATQVQLNIDASNVISATIVADSVTANELKSNAVTTAKIADKNVTKAKLADAVQTSLGKADTAYQKPSTGIAKADLAEGVQTSLGKADSSIQTAMGAYVNKMTGTESSNYVSTQVVQNKLTVTLDIGEVSTDTAGVADARNVKSYVDSLWEWEELE